MKINNKYLIEIKTVIVTIILCLVFATMIISAKSGLLFWYYFNGLVLFLTINRLIHYYFTTKEKEK